LARNLNVRRVNVRPRIDLAIKTKPAIRATEITKLVESGISFKKFPNPDILDSVLVTEAVAR
jgi:hypothetical protein